MTLEFELPLFSLIFSILLIFTYFSKPTIGLKENKCFEVILIASALEILIDTYIHFICALNDFSVIVSNYYSLFNILNKILVLLFIIIFSSLLCYTLIISYDKVRKNPRKVVIGLNIVFIISFIILIFTKITLIEVGSVTNVKGTTTTFGYMMVAIMLVMSLIVALKNIKKMDKRYFPIFFIIALLGILYLVTIVLPGLIIYDIVLILLCYTMYFTIENPDLQMLNEFRSAKKYADDLNNQKSEFLFQMTNEIKEPIRTINRVTKRMMMENDITILKQDINEIKYSSSNLLELVNKVLDINSLETRKVMIRESGYSTAKLFAEINAQTKLKLKKSSVDFRFKYDDSTPKELYGDVLRLKQIIVTLIDNAIKYTKEGFIELSVNFVIKFDICRLIITVEDSGIGMMQEQIEHLFDKKENEIANIEEKNLNLKSIKTLLDLIGGTIITKSEKNHGTKFTLILDQRIVNHKENKTAELAKKIDDLNEKKVKILLVIDNPSLENKLKRLSKHYSMDIITVFGGQSCLEKIRNREAFDLIIIEDELKKLSSVATLVKLKQIEGVQTPVILLTHKAGIIEKENYIKKGFTAVYALPITKDFIKEIDSYVVKK